MKNLKLVIFIALLLVCNIGPAASDFNLFQVANKIDNPFIDQNNLYQQIFNELNHEYEHIGKLEARKIIDGKLIVTGGLNSVGFSYQKPFLDFSIGLNRTVTPEFNSNKWIVTDSLTIHIDASKILNKLSTNQNIDITKENLALFAGIVFERKFLWFHTANSYEEGLSTHFEKLFFPFIGIKYQSLLKLENNEIITKEDSISVNAGGFVSAPIYTGVSAMGGVLAKFQKLSKMEMTRLNDLTGIDSLMISYEKSKSTMTGISLKVQADFLKILKMTLLSYDFSYEHSQSYKIFTKFPMSVLSSIDESDPIVFQIKKLIIAKEPDIEAISKYIISEENRISEVISHRFNFLLLGGSKSAKTEEINVMANGVDKIFFRHYYEKIKYTEDILSRLFASFIYAIFNSEIKSSTTVSDTKKVTLEYDSIKNLINTNEDLDIGTDIDSQKLSLSFEGKYNTKKTTGVFGSKYKDRAKFILDRYSGVDPMAVELIVKDYLIAPFNVEGTYQVNTDGIRHFNSLKVATVFDEFNSLCDEKPKKSFFNFLSLFDNCRRSLQNEYMSYFKNLSHDKITSDSILKCESKANKFLFNAGKKRLFVKSCLENMTYTQDSGFIKIPLWELKDLSQNLVNHINSKIYYYNLFGINNVFFHGFFTAKTVSGGDFITYFHEGSFKGLGVVDNYLRATQMRSPSSIVVDQK